MPKKVVCLQKRRDSLQKTSAGFNKSEAEHFIDGLVRVSAVVVPTGDISFINHKADNLVLETAILGGCDALVTGDKKHLLPLKFFQGVALEAPSQFLLRFGE